MWVRFTETFRWRPTNNTSVRYLAGMRVMVTQRCGTKAIAQGKAVKSTNPKSVAKNGKASKGE